MSRSLATTTRAAGAAERAGPTPAHIAPTRATIVNSDQDDDRRLHASSPFIRRLLWPASAVFAHFPEGLVRAYICDIFRSLTCDDDEILHVETVARRVLIPGL